MLNGLDLFSGIGGITIALKDWVKPVAYCEIERYAQSVLLQRMADNDLPRAPIWDDITSLRGTMLPEIDIIYGGFPCQDLSVCGNGAGLEGKRSGLFFEVVRLASEIRPQYIFLENVPAIAVRGLDRVLLELTALGYDSRWTIVSAAEVGAPHLRERWFLLAHSNHKRHENESGPSKSEYSSTMRRCENVPDSDGFGWGAIQDGKDSNNSTRNGKKKSMANANSKGLEGRWGKESKFGRSAKSSWWKLEPDVGRMANGVPLRVDRIKGLGNSVVPEQVREAFERLMGFHTGPKTGEK